MMTRTILTTLLLLAGCAPAVPTGPVLVEQRLGASGERRLTGPGLACTEAFALDLRAGETLRRTDRMEDFVVYRLEGPHGEATLYAGNYPQPGGTELRTGRNFPAVVSITGVSLEDRVFVHGRDFARCAKG